MSDPSKLRVCSFESRRATEMQALIERHGGTATVVPSMQEVPLDENPAPLRLLSALQCGEVTAVIFLTGVGAETLAGALTQQGKLDEFLNLIRSCRVIARGPKPRAVLRTWELEKVQTVPEPNTWRELLEVVDECDLGAGETVAVQEYGIPNEDLYRALRDRDLKVLPVPVYRWKLPDDTSGLAAAVRSTIAGEFDALLFTSAQQVRNVLEIADEIGSGEAFRQRAASGTIASIGPTCSETLRQLGLPVHFEASPPKMGPLVRGTLETLRAASD